MMRTGETVDIDLSARLARGLVLVGYRGTGKSTVGRLLAGRLTRPFADADSELESRLNCSITELFAIRGEAIFRDEEEITLRELTGRPGLILATGGGVILRPANRECLRAFGLVVWLRATPEEIAARLRRGDGVARRPALTSAGTLEEIDAVLSAREPLYEAVADIAIKTAGLTPAQVAEAILAAVAGEETDRD